MPSFEVGRNAPALTADARQVIGDAIRVVGRLEEASTAVAVDEFSSPYGCGPAELAVLLASGGVALFWTDDSPVYEVRRLKDACRLLEQVGAALDADEGTLHLRVSPDASDVARERSSRRPSARGSSQQVRDPAWPRRRCPGWINSMISSGRRSWPRWTATY